MPILVSLLGPAEARPAWEFRRERGMEDVGVFLFPPLPAADFLFLASVCLFLFVYALSPRSAWLPLLASLEVVYGAELLVV